MHSKNNNQSAIRPLGDELRRMAAAASRFFIALSTLVLASNALLTNWPNAVAKVDNSLTAKVWHPNDGVTAITFKDDVFLGVNADGEPVDGAQITVADLQKAIKKSKKRVSQNTAEYVVKATRVAISRGFKSKSDIIKDVVTTLAAEAEKISI